MRIIPVIDLLDGVAVHARRGQRSGYQPVSTRLSPEAAPRTVVTAYLSLYPFPTVYIADLNAIQETGDNDALVDELLAAFPQVEFWLDAGTRTLQRQVPQIRPVLGSESGITPNGLRELIDARPVLSLDFNASGLMGSPELLQKPQAWPNDVILMSLPRVGSEAGPALDLCREMHALSGGSRHLYLGGGVRDADDLQRAAEAGAAGMLIATALHSGALRQADLSLAFRQAKKTPA